MMLSLDVLAAASASLGLLSHWAWFVRGEHDLLVLRYISAYGIFQATALFVLTRIAALPFLGAITVLTVADTSYLAALFSSIIVYRLFFHKLNRFPGPLSWRLSKFTHALANADCKGYKHLDDLHQQYGPVVRTGPSELSIVDPAAPQLVLGPGTKCTKAPWYDVGNPLVSMHQCRDKKTHDVRRRIWDKGFNAKSLRDYESRVAGYADRLMNQLKAFGGKPLNASRWFNYYSFDVMGELAFGESFHMLDSGEKHFAIPLLEAGMAPMNFIPALPWFFYVIAQLPIISIPYQRFINWSGEQVERRKQMKPSEPDIMSHLLDAPPMSTSAYVNKQWEVGDSRLIIVAGSDTTAATITYCVYELIKNPRVCEQLRKDVSTMIHDGKADYAALQSCPLLNAVIDETLRLHPPVPSGLIRIAPPEGIQIGDTFVPPHTTIALPLYTLQRSPEAFEHPNEFVPERWTTSPELVKRKGAFAPFSLGAFSCVGKQLAYMEVRTVLAKLLTEFAMDFAPGEDGSGFIENTEDHFTLNLADLNITCTPRKS